MATGYFTFLVQVSLLALVSANSVIFHKILFQNLHPRPHQSRELGEHTQIVMERNDQILPCPGEGFFVHPQNCTRFYRCVDYSGTGNLFSRYLFECPKEHIFLTAMQTCLPGTCIGIVQPVVVPTPSPLAPADEVPVTEEPQTESPFGEASATVTPTSIPGEVEVTESPVPVTVFPGGESSATTEESQHCTDKYVQHSMYCNVYHRCDDANERYVCPGGTVFDQPRQMCRISAFDDGYCVGKEVFRHPFLLRSENIGTHVRLPASIILPTRMNFVPKTASPFQLALWPTPRPIGVNKVNRPVLRPIIQRPAQVYTRQDLESPQATFNVADDEEVQRPAFKTPASTRPLAQVRRPYGHLHFPSFYFGVPQQKVIVA